MLLAIVALLAVFPQLATFLPNLGTKAVRARPRGKLKPSGPLTTKYAPITAAQMRTSAFGQKQTFPMFSVMSAKCQ